MAPPGPRGSRRRFAPPHHEGLMAAVGLRTALRPRLMSDANTPRIALLGVPIEIGASQLGTLMGPDALRTAGIGRILEQLGFAVEDHGNMARPEASTSEGSPPANAKYYDTIKGWIRALSERSYALAR